MNSFTELDVQHKNDFYSKVRDIETEHQHYVHNIDKDVKKWNEEKVSLLNELGKQGEKLLIAEMQGNESESAQILRDIEAINNQAKELEQKIYGYSKIDVRNILVSHFDSIKSLIPKTEKEVDENARKIADYETELRFRMAECAKELEKVETLKRANSATNKKISDDITKLIAQTFSLSLEHDKGKIELIRKALLDNSDESPKSKIMEALAI